MLYLPPLLPLKDLRKRGRENSREEMRGGRKKEKKESSLATLRSLSFHQTMWVGRERGER